MDLIDRFLKAGMNFQSLKRGLDEEHDPSSMQFALSIGDPVPVHESPDIVKQSFEEFQELARAYLDHIKTTYLANADWLTSDDGAIASLSRPERSRPIYFITVEDSTSKKIVYVGRTSGESGRFVGGHTAISKLHHPDYSHKKKMVYMCEVLVRIQQDDWVNIEFPVAGPTMLSLLESQLIFQLDPELNAAPTKIPQSAMFDIVHDNRHKLDKMDDRYFDLHGLQELLRP